MGMPPLAPGALLVRVTRVRLPVLPALTGPVLPAAAAGLGVGALAAAAVLAPASGGLATLVAGLSCAAIVAGIQRVRRFWMEEPLRPQSDHLLAERNHQLQVLLQAGRAMNAMLDLEQVLQTVVDQVAAHTRFEQAAVLLGPDPAGEFRIAARRGPAGAQVRGDDAMLRRILQGHIVDDWAHQPLIVEDARRDFRTADLRPAFVRAGIRSLVTVPMQIQGRLIGVLAVYQGRTATYTTAEVSWLTALAAQAALAVENARLYTLAVSNQVRLDKAVEFLQNVSAALTRTQVGVPPVLRSVAQAIANLFEPAMVCLVFDQPEDAAAPEQVTAHCGVDPSRGPWCGETARAPAEATWPAALSLPVHVDGRRLAHFEIYLAGAGRTVDSRERSILQAFVHLTASALGNAGLVHKLRAAVQETERAYMGTLEALTRALEIRDHETEGHSRRVVQYTLALAQQVGLTESQLVPMMRGALLHDIGKIGIPDRILRKPGPLTPDEWETMKTHTRIGYEMLYPIEFLRDVTSIILHHHERYDGSGYPCRLKGDEIPIGARIFAVADAYDAMTSDRPYRRGRDHAGAVREIVRCAGTHFDPQVVDALLSIPAEELRRIRDLSSEVPMVTAPIPQRISR